ncbi:MAG TPA: sigma-70 family RNA polymerase sigma factor [Methylophilaceae bacterium]|nr:sigma-70 family RNA polymerase sigma factor [Methylophilaceae bacterium]
MSTLNTLEQELDNGHDWLVAHGDFLYRFALARLKNPELAEDVVQETLLAAIQGAKFSGKSNVRTWLTGILKHKIIDTFCRQQHEMPLPDDDELGDAEIDDFFDARGRWIDRPGEWELPTDELEQKQFLQTLQACINRLPESLAQVFMLREVHEEETTEICSQLGITASNAWVMLHRARLSLRQCLELNWLGR